MTGLHNQLSRGVQVFVYGTLKPGEINYQRYCAAGLVAAQRATTLGKLFALPMGYPAATQGNDCVHGYLFTFADVEILDPLDELEDYQPTRENAANLYDRQKVKVYNSQGLSLGWAWIYLMHPEKIEKFAGIYLPSGCWSGDSQAANSQP